VPVTAISHDRWWWLDEIELDPGTPPVRMGTHALGDQPWLLVDDQRAAELALKADLHARHPDEVFAAGAATEVPGAEVCTLVERAGLVIEGTGSHPLRAAGLAVQEDLCLLRRSPEGWILDGASVSFPSRWRLAEKIGRPLGEVHAPVAGYVPQLDRRVTALIDRLDHRIVRRRNWFAHPDRTLFQPERPIGGDPVIGADRVWDDLWLRSERQTLRRLDLPGWALFTIRVQQAPLGELGARRPDALRRFLQRAEPAAATHHGLGPDQAAEILAAGAYGGSR
jgi:dimethylamine monooxygenase subunit A